MRSSDADHLGPLLRMDPRRPDQHGKRAICDPLGAVRVGLHIVAGCELDPHQGVVAAMIVKSEEETIRFRGFDVDVAAVKHADDQIHPAVACGAVCSVVPVRDQRKCRVRGASFSVCCEKRRHQQFCALLHSGGCVGRCALPQHDSRHCGRYASCHADPTDFGVRGLVPCSRHLPPHRLHAPVAPATKSFSCVCLIDAGRLPAAAS